MKILGAWSTNARVKQGMKVIISAQYSCYLDRLPDKIVSLRLAPKQRLSSTSRGVIAAKIYVEERERQDFRADEILTRWICEELSCPNKGQWCYVNPKEVVNGVAQHFMIRQTILPQ